MNADAASDVMNVCVDGWVEDVESDLLEAAQYMSSQLIRDNLLWLILGRLIKAHPRDGLTKMEEGEREGMI